MPFCLQTISLAIGQRMVYCTVFVESGRFYWNWATGRPLIFVYMYIFNLIQNGYTALMSAVRWGRADIVQFLVGNGADINIENCVRILLILWFFRVFSMKVHLSVLVCQCTVFFNFCVPMLPLRADSVSQVYMLM